MRTYRRSTCLASLISVCATLPWLACAQAQEAREFAPAQNAVGYLQTLSQRGAKQYLMFQFRIGDTISKAPIQKTVEDFDRTLGALRNGNRLEGIPAPPNPAIREHVEKIEQDWAVLRKIYTYDPVTLRRETNLIPFEEQRQDPILVRYVDRLTTSLQSDIDTLGIMYQDGCSGAGHTDCGVGIRESGQLRMLTEAIAQDILMVVLSIAPGKSKERLRQHASLFEATFQDMTSGTDSAGGLGQTMLQTINGYWQQLKIDVDLAAGGKHGNVDIDRLLRVHRELIEEIDSYAIMAVANVKSGA